MRTGTTFFYHYLKDHSEVNMASQKDIFFFDKNFYRGKKWYNSFFQKNKKIYGEVSTSYYLDEKAIKNISKSFKNVKIILINRDRKSSIISLYFWDKVVFYFFNPFFFLKKKNFQTFIKDPRVKKSVDFENIYKILKKHFYKKNILVISFDRFKKNNDHVLKQLCKFIQIKFYKKKTIKKNVLRNYRFFIFQLVGYFFYKFFKKKGAGKNISIINFFRDNYIINSILFKNISDAQKIKVEKEYNEHFLKNE